MRTGATVAVLLGAVLCAGIEAQEAQWEVNSWVDRFTDERGVSATQEENGTVVELRCENGEYVLDVRRDGDYPFASERVDVRLDDGDIREYWFTPTNGYRTLTARGDEIHGLVEQIFASEMLRVRTSWELRNSEPLEFAGIFDADGLREAFAMTSCLAKQARP